MKKKPPTKSEAVKAIASHNTTAFIKSVGRVECAMRKLDCALAETKLYASMMAPQKGARK